ncbi:hypothetical protein DVH09_15905, partial [Hafnia paralvei]
NGVSDKSARVQRPRAGGLCPYAFTGVSMKLGIDRRAEYYTMLAEWSSQTGAEMASRIKSARLEGGACSPLSRENRINL